MSTRVLTGDAAKQGGEMSWRHLAEPAFEPLSGTPRDLLAEGDPSEAEALRARVAQIEQDAAAREQNALRTGIEQGRAAGERDAAARLDAALKAYAAAAHDLATHRREMRRQAEQDVVKLSIAIARRILHRELTVDAEAMVGLVKAALDKLENREVDRVRVNPADAAHVRGHLERLRPASRIEVVSDNTLERGAAMFESARGNLDASIETQLDEIQRGLADRLQRS